MRTILEINDRVRITSDCNSKGYKGVIIGRYINGRGCNHVMIHLDNGKKHGYNCLSVEKIESEDIKMEGFKNVAIVNLLDDYNKKDYGFALYDEDMDLLTKSWSDEENGFRNLVVTNARGKNNRVLGKVKLIMSAENYGKGVTAQVVGIVNMDAYNARVDEENRLKEIAKKKAEIEKALDEEIKKRKDAEYYEEMAKKYSDNPLIGQLVAELKGLGV